MKQLLITLSFIIPLFVFSKDKPKGYDIKDQKTVACTSVKNQYSSGTCWSFATTSFIESEILKKSGVELDLSEMYFVRIAYYLKAIDFVKFHGKNNFSEGGQAHDVINIIKKYGMVPENVYQGLNYGEKQHIHVEMEAMLEAMLSSLVKNPNNKLSTAWKSCVNAVLDIYLGKTPEKFAYDGKDYTPEIFVSVMMFNPDEYIELTSYRDFPFYTKAVLKIPDNWSRDEYYNVPLDDLMRIINNAIENGYSICWDGDVSEIGFSHKNGIAIIPEKDELTGKDRLDIGVEIVPEKSITQDMRQLTFDNYSTTDDHLMHIVGIAKDQNGTVYYKTKNSWGADSNDFGGFLYMSESYVKLKTVAVMVNINAIPSDIASKLGIEYKN
ncbi:MAG: C1 family peptidase [Marinilabiliales bacterium]